MDEYKRLKIQEKFLLKIQQSQERYYLSWVEPDPAKIDHIMSEKYKMYSYNIQSLLPNTNTNRTPKVGSEREQPLLTASQLINSNTSNNVIRDAPAISLQMPTVVSQSNAGIPEFSTINERNSKEQPVIVLSKPVINNIDIVVHSPQPELSAEKVIKESLNELQNQQINGSIAESSKGQPTENNITSSITKQTASTINVYNSPEKQIINAMSINHLQNATDESPSLSQRQSHFNPFNIKNNINHQSNGASTSSIPPSLPPNPNFIKRKTNSGTVMAIDKLLSKYDDDEPKIEMDKKENPDVLTSKTETQTQTQTQSQTESQSPLQTQTQTQSQTQTQTQSQSQTQTQTQSQTQSQSNTQPKSELETPTTSQTQTQTKTQTTVQPQFQTQTQSNDTDSQIFSGKGVTTQTQTQSQSSENPKSEKQAEFGKTQNNGSLDTQADPILNRNLNSSPIRNYNLRSHSDDSKNKARAIYVR
ncbi:unnamed protein product [[Candida] boidinii]|nr:unnamed protein product [[Candida] boidinii]